MRPWLRLPVLAGASTAIPILTVERGNAVSEDNRQFADRAVCFCNPIWNTNGQPKWLGLCRSGASGGQAVIWCSGLSCCRLRACWGKRLHSFWSPWYIGYRPGSSLAGDSSETGQGTKAVSRRWRLYRLAFSSTYRSDVARATFFQQNPREGNSHVGHRRRRRWYERAGAGEG